MISSKGLNDNNESNNNNNNETNNTDVSNNNNVSQNTTDKNDSQELSSFLDQGATTIEESSNIISNKMRELSSKLSNLEK